MMKLKNKLTAGYSGTSWLVFGGCGSAIPAAMLLTPVSDHSVNPARSTGHAVFVGEWAIKQLWLASIVGSAPAGVVYPLMAGRDSAA